MRNCVLSIISFLLIIGTAQNCLSDEEKNRETIGVRLGYAETTNRLDDAFGAGFIAALHFTEKFNPSAGVDFSFGSFYMGRTSRRDITFDRFRTGDEMRMNIVFMTAAPTLELKMHRDYFFYGSAGLGIYAVTLVRELGYLWGSNTQYHLGVTGGAGFYRVLTENWNLDLNLAVHQLWTDNEFDDWVAVYSEGDQDPFFYQITIGITIDIR
jgi:hypothetical protein